ncbi:VPLPA-CTERM sorting domain-containing protein [Pseudodesulfovibrio portus]|uniref:VPLPA-CTERM protein sorting domain-containing protein n=1 Tax=Pseudodesulfovibrio portus TaxID=231439 RepID=A0ABN6RUJ4_9BACT|nr:VPLPA-CTERM sorting domain-containing protein [Pseudodesulfovibrio portus]BDQ34767.1 hypothetical protein JCM14722_23090 [Pseudodesulfovibrio portus]
MSSRIMILTVLSLLIFGTSAFAAPMYADTAYDYTPGLNVGTARSITGNALDAPDASLRADDNDIRFLSLGIGSYDSSLPAGTDYTGNGYGGSVYFSFASNFTGWATIYETTYSRSGYNEFASVLGSLDGLTWTFLGDINNQNVDADGGYTVTFSGIYKFLKVVDTTALNGGVLADGFDIDAVKVNPTPVPGAVWLLGSGLVGLVGLRRRFSA